MILQTKVDLTTIIATLFCQKYLILSSWYAVLAEMIVFVIRAAGTEQVKIVCQPARIEWTKLIKYVVPEFIWD